MRPLLIAAASVFLVASVSSADARRFRFGSVHVGGYTRSSAAQVPPHARPAPDGTRAGNWTVGGAVVPIAGRSGTRSASAAPRRASGDGGSTGTSAGALPEAAEAPALASAPAEWCPAKAVAGSGAGFCLVN
ncbi:MAG TPA: hypothetical protein VF601_04230 [Beijerinckiaceae bacterium]|jgi:hypothetical protein